MAEQDETTRADEGQGGSLTLPQAMELAMTLHRRGRLDAAEEIYERVLAIDAEHVDALHLMGLSRHQRQDRARALALVRRAVALAPGHVDAINNLGNILVEDGQLDEAEATYQRVLDLRPEFANAHANLGIVRRRKHDLAGAETALRRALALDPKHGAAHHNLGAILQDTDRPGEALASFQQALTLLPYDGDSYRRVGATLYALGRAEEAAAIYQKWVAEEPDNAIAQHMLAAASGKDVPARASDAFVQSTFDAFAASFDRVLGRLEYRAPAIVAEAVARLVGSVAALDVLDAGAGTGLCGPLLRPYAGRLVAIDLSPGMLEQARARHVYDELETAELTAYMHAHPGAFDLIVSADTLVYFGDLGPAAAAAATALRPGGHLVFTLERATGEEEGGFRLMPHGRYAHAEAHVRAVLAAAGLEDVQVTAAQPRLENKQPVDGLLVTARRSRARRTEPA